MTNLLDKTFVPILKQLIYNCKKEGITMVPYEGLRSPQMQARYWVQGRSLAEVQSTVDDLKQERAFFLVKCIEAADTKDGPIITNALPGCSWHQWGEAVDCYWLLNGSKIWDTITVNNAGINGYKLYADVALKLGLDAGYYWQGIVDAVHVQLKKEASPLKLYTLKEIDEIMRDFYAKV